MDDVKQKETKGIPHRWKKGESGNGSGRKNSIISVVTSYSDNVSEEKSAIKRLIIIEGVRKGAINVC